MSETLTPKQTLLMWCLLARQGVAAQAEIEPTVVAADRTTLERRRLVTSLKEGRRLMLRLGDEGWAWAGEHLGDPLPKNYGALRDFLVLLRRHLDETGEVLGDFIGTPAASPGSAGENGKKISSKTTKSTGERAKKAGATSKAGTGTRAEAKSETKKAKTKKAGPRKAGTKAIETKTGKTKTVAPPEALSLRQNIEAAYFTVTGSRKGVDAKLADVRRHLAPSLGRAAVDAELRAMQGKGKARLMRQDDRRALTPADEDAAVRHAGEAFHILWIFE